MPINITKFNEMSFATMDTAVIHTNKWQHR